MKTYQNINQLIKIKYFVDNLKNNYKEDQIFTIKTKMFSSIYGENMIDVYEGDKYKVLSQLSYLNSIISNEYDFNISIDISIERNLIFSIHYKNHL